MAISTAQAGLIPTIHQEPIFGVCIEAYGVPNNWRLYTTADAPNRSVLRALSIVAGRKTCSHMYTLDPSQFNAKVAVPHHFSPLYERVNEEAEIHVHGTVMADAVLILPGDGAFMATADCWTLVVVQKDHHNNVVYAVVAHCGRDSVLRNDDIIRNTFHALGARDKFNPNLMHAFISTGIHGLNFRHPRDHPQHGPKNHAMLSYIEKRWTTQCLVGDKKDGIHIPSIVIMELQRLGVPHQNIEWDGGDTFKNKELWSHRAGDSDRNGMFVFV